MGRKAITPSTSTGATDFYFVKSASEADLAKIERGMDLTERKSPMVSLSHGLIVPCGFGG